MFKTLVNVAPFFYELIHLIALNIDFDFIILNFDLLVADLKLARE